MTYFGIYPIHLQIDQKLQHWTSLKLERILQSKLKSLNIIFQELEIYQAEYIVKMSTVK